MTLLQLNQNLSHQLCKGDDEYLSFLKLALMIISIKQRHFDEKQRGISCKLSQISKVHH